MQQMISTITYGTWILSSTSCLTTHDAPMLVLTLTSNIEIIIIVVIANQKYNSRRSAISNQIYYV